MYPHPKALVAFLRYGKNRIRRLGHGAISNLGNLHNWGLGSRVGAKAGIRDIAAIGLGILRVGRQAVIDQPIVVYNVVVIADRFSRACNPPAVVDRWV